MSAAHVKRLLPFLAWPRMARATLGEDLGAGVTVSLLVIPQSLAYAQLAGVPAQHGLYAAFIPSIVGVLFGSSALLSTGPVAITSLLTAATVGHLATPGSGDFVAFVMLLALLSGLMQIGLGLARAGVLLNLLSHPVLVGFINAAAIVIIMSQLPTLTGIAVLGGDTTLGGFFRSLTALDTVHVPTLAMGLGAMAMLLGLKHVAPKLPGALVTVVALTVLSYGIGYADIGGAVVGDIPAGLPGLSVPAMSWDASMALLPAAFIVALVSFMEAMSSCKVIAHRTRTRWDENQELIGQGLAKVAAAFCHSMPVSGSFSRSALNLATGARTAYATLLAAAFVLLVLLLATPLLYHLPKPVLAAMIVLAVSNLIDLPAIRSAWRAGRDDGLAAALTFATTLFFAPSIQNGIMAGITFSLGAFIYRRMMPRIVVRGLAADGGTRELRPGHEKIVLLRFDAALFFANASFFEEAVRELERENPQLEFIVLQAHGINLLDATGVEMLRNLVRHLRSRGITLTVVHPKPHFLEVAGRTGLLQEIGPSNVFGFETDAVTSLLDRLNPRSETS